MDNSDVMTVKDAAAFLQVTTRTIFKLLKDRQLRAAKIGGIWRFSRRNLSELIENSVNTNQRPRPVGRRVAR